MTTRARRILGGVAALGAAVAFAVGVGDPVEAMPHAAGAPVGLTNGDGIAVPATGTAGPAGPYPSTIDATFPDGYVVIDLDLSLDGVEHTFPGDIDAMLVAPNGFTNTVILSDTGGGDGITDVDLRFDDEAATTVPSPIVAGTYQPTEAAGSADSFPFGPPLPSGTVALSNFDGVDPNGTWKLYVADDNGADAGSIAGWSLDFTVAPICDGKLPTIIGTEEADTLVGTPGDDVIAGLGGNDTITGDDGNDTICAGEGDDEISGQVGTDKVYGQGGDDTLVAAATADGADVLAGGVGTDLATYALRSTGVSLTLNGAADDGTPGEHDRLQTVENLTGSEGNDFLSGSSLDNVLLGMGGNDKLRDFPGADHVFGGDGDDTFVAPSNADSGDEYDGGPDVDRILYSSRGQPVTITLAGGADDGTGGEGDSISGIEDAVGGGGADTIVGTTGDDILFGNGGIDLITDGPGADDVNGGGGNDVFMPPTTPDSGDVYNGGPGIDTIDYASRASSLVLTLNYGASNDGAAGEGDWLIAMENAFGGFGDDTITGSVSDNYLRGWGGSDVITGGGGSDLLLGDGAADTLDTVDGIGGNDTANGGNGADTATIDPGDTQVNIP
ncbi:hypothetical protein F0U44_02950 [Nocardioides humilatus]|uniref:P/Homo B domain-containing protein n=1 Tax=Nocardioides humilatus TaxID=2607660 RepID=A0A5B1LKK5_9ACTN|nr:hypothetical protein [Nocardioides humilatus]KAA1421285.1 hypothetical protein F0U44_02950 [Nocardioides humilatus]